MSWIGECSICGEMTKVSGSVGECSACRAGNIPVIKNVHCNKCGQQFNSHYKNLARIICPKCKSNESLSIRS